MEILLTFSWKGEAKKFFKGELLKISSKGVDGESHFSFSLVLLGVAKGLAVEKFYKHIKIWILKENKQEEKRK